MASMIPFGDGQYIDPLTGRLVGGRDTGVLGSPLPILPPRPATPPAPTGPVPGALAQSPPARLPWSGLDNVPDALTPTPPQVDTNPAPAVPIPAQPVVETVAAPPVQAPAPGPAPAPMAAPRPVVERPAPPSPNAPLSVRNNNPGNLRFVGQTGAVAGDGGFAKFPTPEAGTAAMASQLLLYAERDGLDTVGGIIGKWAPPSENNTAAYVNTVAQALGVGPGDKINLRDPKTLETLMAAMAKVEGGPGAGAITPGGWQAPPGQAPIPAAAAATPPPQLPGVGAQSFGTDQFKSTIGDQAIAFGAGMMGGGTFSQAAGRGLTAVSKLAAEDRGAELKGAHLQNETARLNETSSRNAGLLSVAQQRADAATRNSQTAESRAGTAEAALAERNRQAAARTEALQARINAPAGRAQLARSLKDEGADIGPQVIAEGVAAVPNINAIIKTIDEGNWASSSWFDKTKQYLARATGMNILGMDPSQIDINDKQISELANQLAVATGIRIMSGRELQMITKGFASVGTNPEATKAMVIEKRDALLARQKRAKEWNAMDPAERNQIMSTPGYGYGRWATGWMMQNGNAPHDSETPITTTGPDGKPVATPSPYTMKQDDQGRTIFTPHGGAPITIR